MLICCRHMHSRLLCWQVTTFIGAGLHISDVWNFIPCSIRFLRWILLGIGDIIQSTITNYCVDYQCHIVSKSVWQWLLIALGLILNEITLCGWVQYFLMLRKVALIILKSDIPIVFSYGYLIKTVNTPIFWQFLQQLKDTQLHVLKPDLTFYSYVAYFMRSHFNKKSNMHKIWNLI